MVQKMGFESFLGNPKIVSVVRQMLASGRAPGALLFSGPDGVGKKTLAIMLAKALNCQSPGPHGDNFCGQCPRCRKAETMMTAAREDLARRREIKEAQRRVEGLVYFDLQLIEPLTRFILIEQIRQLRQIAFTRPFEFPRRVFILDQAQALHWQAIDLLLKVLEEPPETTTLMLICPNRYELRSTIRSRCFHLQFSRVDEPVIQTLLSAERRLPKAWHAVAARVSAGSVAKAKAFDPEDFERRRRPWAEFLEAIAGKAASSARGIDWKTVFDSTKALSENRAEFEETLKLGHSLLRDMMLILSAGPDSGVVNLDLLPRLIAWSAQLTLAKIERLKAGLDEAYRLQIRNVNQQLGLDTLAIDLVSSASPPATEPAL